MSDDEHHHIEFRSTVEAIVADLVTGDYEALVERSRGVRLTVENLRYGVQEYPATPIAPPAQGWWPKVDVVRVAARDAFAVSAPMWTEEEGLSDLYLELTLVPRHDGGYDVELDDLLH